MVKIGDLLADKQKAVVVTSAIEAGQVFRIKLTEMEGIKPKNQGDNSRNKYFVVLGVDNDKAIGAVLINTAINQNLSPMLKRLHYPIHAKNYPFLQHDSFVDCGSLKPISKEKYGANLDKQVGMIDDQDLNLIRKTVAEDAPIEAKTLKRFKLIE
jgi:hypothetical protein